jgi:hypothetical protein
MRNLFLKKMQVKTLAKTSVIIIIPYILYVSKSVFRSTIRKAYFFSINITPFIAIGVCFGKKVKDHQFDLEETSLPIPPGFKPTKPIPPKARYFKESQDKPMYEK